MSKITLGLIFFPLLSTIGGTWLQKQQSVAKLAPQANQIYKPNNGIQLVPLNEDDISSVAALIVKGFDGEFLWWQGLQKTYTIWNTEAQMEHRYNKFIMRRSRPFHLMTVAKDQGVAGHFCCVCSPFPTLPPHCLILPFLSSSASEISVVLLLAMCITFSHHELFRDGSFLFIDSRHTVGYIELGLVPINENRSSPQRQYENEDDKMDGIYVDDGLGYPHIGNLVVSGLTITGLDQLYT